jgi:hypothetical protein
MAYASNNYYALTADDELNDVWDIDEDTTDEDDVTNDELDDDVDELDIPYSDDD